MLNSEEATVVLWSQLPTKIHGPDSHRYFYIVKHFPAHFHHIIVSL